MQLVLNGIPPRPFMFLSLNLKKFMLYNLIFKVSATFESAVIFNYSFKVFTLLFNIYNLPNKTFCNNFLLNISQILSDFPTIRYHNSLKTYFRLCDHTAKLRSRSIFSRPCAHARTQNVLSAAQCGAHFF